MRQELIFTKMVASGNDFVVVEDRYPGVHYPSFAKYVCDRKFGVGADGVLLLGKSKKADIRMRIFNADGSEAEMCGNGARCTAFFAAHGKRKELSIETKAGIIYSEVSPDRVRIQLTDPRNWALGIGINVLGRKLSVDFVNTGVPHTVIFVEALDSIDVKSLGSQVRYHARFQPAGTNVDLVEVVDRKFIRVRTYERGVEDETLACGTGSTASALVFAARTGAESPVKVKTRSGEVLTVYFKRKGDTFTNVWLEGTAGVIFAGRLFRPCAD